ncbi:hypothetical protein GYA49_05010 [Candidatus Beckwithbacteria bacterium]|nr:hypothetical protein [Candidatus Beckwithbacteria bacterium]
MREREKFNPYITDTLRKLLDNPQVKKGFDSLVQTIADHIPDYTLNVAPDFLIDFSRKVPESLEISGQQVAKEGLLSSLNLIHRMVAYQQIMFDLDKFRDMIMDQVPRGITGDLAIETQADHIATALFFSIGVESEIAKYTGVVTTRLGEVSFTTFLSSKDLKEEDYLRFFMIASLVRSDQFLVDHRKTFFASRLDEHYNPLVDTTEVNDYDKHLAVGLGALFELSKQFEKKEGILAEYLATQNIPNYQIEVLIFILKKITSFRKRTHTSLIKGEFNEEKNTIKALQIYLSNGTLSTQKELLEYLGLVGQDAITKMFVIATKDRSSSPLYRVVARSILDVIDLFDGSFFREQELSTLISLLETDGDVIDKNELLEKINIAKSLKRLGGEHVVEISDDDLQVKIVFRSADASCFEMRVQIEGRSCQFNVDIKNNLFRHNIILLLSEQGETILQNLVLQLVDKWLDSFIEQAQEERDERLSRGQALVISPSKKPRMQKNPRRADRGPGEFPNTTRHRAISLIRDSSDTTLIEETKEHQVHGLRITYDVREICKAIKDKRLSGLIIEALALLNSDEYEGQFPIKKIPSIKGGKFKNMFRLSFRDITGANSEISHLRAILRSRKSSKGQMVFYIEKIGNHDDVY